MLELTEENPFNELPEALVVEIQNEFPKAKIFKKNIGNQVGFTRIGTK